MRKHESILKVFTPLFSKYFSSWKDDQCKVLHENSRYGGVMAPSDSSWDLLMWPLKLIVSSCTIPIEWSRHLFMHDLVSDIPLTRAQIYVSGRTLKIWKRIAVNSCSFSHISFYPARYEKAIDLKGYMQMARYGRVWSRHLTLDKMFWYNSLNWSPFHAQSRFYYQINSIFLLSFLHSFLLVSHQDFYNRYQSASFFFFLFFSRCRLSRCGKEYKDHIRGVGSEASSGKSKRRGIWSRECLNDRYYAV